MVALCPVYSWGNVPIFPSISNNKASWALGLDTQQQNGKIGRGLLDLYHITWIYFRVRLASVWFLLNKE